MDRWFALLRAEYGVDDSVLGAQRWAALGVPRSVLRRGARARAAARNRAAVRAWARGRLADRTRRARTARILRHRGWIGLGNPRRWRPELAHALRVISRSGYAARLARVAYRVLDDAPHATHFARWLARALREGWVPPLRGSVELPEDIDTRRANRRGRRSDRIAQRDREWAISHYPEDYELGLRASRAVLAAVEWMRSVRASGTTIVVHGRDGELLYQCARLSGVRVRYALTPRALTTHANGAAPGYARYLARVVPSGAIHVDTGFRGSVPRWFGANDHEIALLNAEDTFLAMPIDNPPRDLVLELEHAPQRLRPLQFWDQRVFDERAGAFWARVYGALEGEK